MTRVALITTTINVPHVLTQWARSMSVDDIIIVAGDQTSPHDEILDLLIDISERTGVNTQYLHPNRQTLWASSEAIGWKSIQRRNIALLEAMQLNPRYILTVDDDNAPSVPTGQISKLIRIFEDRGNDNFIQTNTGWFNPGRSCVDKRYRSVIHRGFPLDRRREQPFVSSAPPCQIGVAAMLWTGAPDIDAIDRIVNDPIIERVGHDDVILTPGTWAPFNSQATMYRTELAPLMMVWPGVGRYDDIWASYLARRVMDEFKYGVYYGHPTVHQDRNEHDSFRDLDAEMHGMQYTPMLTDFLRTVDLSNESTITGAMGRVQAELARLCGKFIPSQTIRAFDAWQRDLEMIKWED
jgi:hypothetical protein